MRKLSFAKRSLWNFHTETHEGPIHLNDEKDFLDSDLKLKFSSMVKCLINHFCFPPKAFLVLCVCGAKHFVESGNANNFLVFTYLWMFYAIFLDLNEIEP